MKFIRLVSDDSSGVLDNDFNSDIIFSEKAQIAYRSLAVDIDPHRFEVNNTNNDISYQSSIVDATSLGTGDLTLATYSETNASDLLTDIQNKLNSIMNYNSKTVGHQFQAIVKGGKTRIETQFCPNNVKILQQNFQGEFGATKNNMTVTGGSIAQNDPGGAGVANDNNIAISFQEFGKGTAVFRTRIKRHTDNAGASNTNGFEFGLTNVNPATLINGSPINLTDAQKFYNFKAQKVADNYVFNAGNGVFDDNSGIPPNIAGPDSVNNDIIEFRKEGLFLKCILYRSSQPVDSPGDLLFTDNLNTRFPTGAGDPLRTGINTPLYPYIICHGDGTTFQLDGSYTRCFFDPYRSNIKGIVSESEESAAHNHGALGARPVSARPARLTDSQITFNSIELAQYLGFTSIVLNSEDPLRQVFVKHSTNNFRAVATYDNLIVELMNIDLQSFDGLHKGRRSILATVPTVRDANGTIVNEANNLIFIDLNNANPISLRNIKARILLGDLTEPQVTGLTSVSLIVKNKGE